MIEDNKITFTCFVRLLKKCNRIFCINSHENFIAKKKKVKKKISSTYIFMVTSFLLNLK